MKAYVFRTSGDPVDREKEEFETLEELTEFFTTHGDVVVHSDNDDIPGVDIRLEIYDDYRE